MQTFRVIQHNKRGSFLVQAKEIDETNGVIKSIRGPYRMTSHGGKAILKSNTLGLGCKYEGLFTFEDYTFKPVKRKSI